MPLRLIAVVREQACSWRSARVLSTVFAGSLAAGAALSQELSIPRSDAPPELAEFVSMAPTDAVRARYAVVTGFTQRNPQDGAPASQRTEVFLAYDERNLYAVFLAFDTDPKSVRANLSPREDVDNDDNLGLVIDTFDDQRTAYGFYANALGVQWDGRFSEVTRGGWDESYEAVWYTDAQLTDGGYVVVMTIPFRTMRFPETGEQRWRVQFERNIPRSSEASFWPPFSQAIDGRLNQAAVLNGVRDVSPGRNIQLIPFAFVRSYDVLDRSPANPGFDKDTESDIGLDAKVVLRDSFVLDFTYNPDFSQVESDQPQVTVNERFEVQFPERRPFFLENTDYFATETPLLFTRRIVDPEVGVKFTGRQGPWGIGTMLTNDEAPGLRLDPGDPLYGEDADVSVVRIFRDFGEQSRAGVMHTEREFGETYSRVSAADTYVRLNENWLTELLVVNTENRDDNGLVTTGRQTNWRFNRSSRNFNAHYHWTEQSADFAVPLGILSRNYTPDAQGLHGFMQYSFWPEDSWMDRIGPRLFFANQDDQAGMRIYSEFSPQLQVTWPGNSFFAAGTNKIRERLREGDFPGLVDPLDFSQKRWFVDFSTDMSQKVGFGFAYDEGTAINFVPAAGLPTLADRALLSANVRWRPMDRLRVDTTYLSTSLDDRNGGGAIFDDRIFRTRVNYQFTKEMSLRVILQHEDTKPTALSSLTRDENLNLDVLFRYVLNPYSALYVGLNTNESNLQLVDDGVGPPTLVRSEDLARDGQQFFVKFSYLLQP
jgi:hypothetical protein